MAEFQLHVLIATSVLPRDLPASSALVGRQSLTVLGLLG